MESSIQLINRNMFDDLARDAESRTRRRINHNFHSTMEDNPHRFLNVLLRGTYIRPHRHLNPPKSESFVCLEGDLLFVIFNDDGQVTQAHQLSSTGNNVGIDISPGVYHTVIADSNRAICFEVKPGPYRVEDDKEFAIWAPEEGSEGVSAYLTELIQQCRKIVVK